MKYLTRIVTFEAYPDILGENPQVMLSGGSRVITQQDKQRVFTVRKVAYDDSMTPMYSSPVMHIEKQYKSLEELKDCHPGLQFSVVLDRDHSLKIYDDEQISANG